MKHLIEKLGDIEAGEISEGYNEAMVKKIAKLTDRNHHTEALIAAARMMGYKGLVKKAELLRQLHKLEGSLPFGLSEYRSYLLKELKGFLQQDLDDAEFDALWGAM